MKQCYVDADLVTKLSDKELHGKLSNSLLTEPIDIAGRIRIPHYELSGGGDASRLKLTNNLIYLFIIYIIYNSYNLIKLIYKTLFFKTKDPSININSIQLHIVSYIKCISKG
jgi:hypothetical protein